MQVIQSLSAWKELRPKMTGTLGLIPTMGALHEGHLVLMRRAREENEIAVLLDRENSSFPDADHVGDVIQQRSQTISRLVKIGLFRSSIRHVSIPGSLPHAWHPRSFAPS